VCQSIYLPKAVDMFDYGFAENGLIAYKLGTQLASQSFIKHVGEEEYKKLVRFILHYIADLDIPIKRCVLHWSNGFVCVCHLLVCNHLGERLLSFVMG
jgi:phosphomannomutase